MGADIALHWMLDMTGAVTFACLLRGCQNPEHRHSKWLRPLVARPWVTQGLTALVVAYVTVRVVG